MGKSSTQTTKESGTNAQTGAGGFQQSAQSQDWMRQLAEIMQQQSQQQQYQQQQSGQQFGQQAMGLDAASQQYVDLMRQQALGGAGQIGAGMFGADPQQINALTQQLMNPYTQNVIGGLGQEFDKLRGAATMDTQQQATAAGAFGGSRHGVAEAQRLSELDRAQQQQVGQLLSGQFNQAQQQAIPLAQQQALAPYQALQAQQQMLGQGLGPTGQVSSNMQQQLESMFGSQQAQQIMQQMQQQQGQSGSYSSQQGTQWQKMLEEYNRKQTQKQSNPWYQNVLGAATTIAPFLLGPAGVAGGAVLKGVDAMNTSSNLG